MSPRVRLILKVVIVTALLGLATFAMIRTFEDLNIGEIRASLRQLNMREASILAAVWAAWLTLQGVQTGALVEGLSARRGMLAFLGPASVAFIIPGPSDLPVRHRMLTSWGVTSRAATLSVAAGGIFNVGIKLVLPVVAAIGLLVSSAPISGTLRTVVVIAISIGAGLVAVSIVASSERRSEWLAHQVQRAWRTIMRWLGKDEPADFVERLMVTRREAAETLRIGWRVATWSTALTAVSKFVLLLLSLRYTGVTDERLAWSEAFVAYSIVQGLTVIPITPGDAGVSELALIGFLSAFAGAGAVNDITAGVILFRLLTWLLVIPLGWMAIGWWRLSLRRGKPMFGPPPRDRASTSG